MTNTRPSASLILAIALLLIPMWYIGSYLAMVKPRPVFRSDLH